MCARGALKSVERHAPKQNTFSPDEPENLLLSAALSIRLAALARCSYIPLLLLILKAKTCPDFNEAIFNGSLKGFLELFMLHQLSEILEKATVVVQIFGECFCYIYINIFNIPDIRKDIVKMYIVSKIITNQVIIIKIFFLYSLLGKISNLRFLFTKLYQNIILNIRIAPLACVSYSFFVL